MYWHPVLIFNLAFAGFYPDRVSVLTPCPYHFRSVAWAYCDSHRAVLSNPVPDRQPCSALCRMASLGPLPQAEIMAVFPEKVSDWTVIHFYPRHETCLGYSEKPINDIQSLSRKPIKWETVLYNNFQLSCCVASVTLARSLVKGEFRAILKINNNQCNKPNEG